MTHATHLADPDRCPLCGQPNHCAMETERQTGIKQTPCWCRSEKIPRRVLDRLAAADVGRACVCATCVKADSKT